MIPYQPVWLYWGRHNAPSTPLKCQRKSHKLYDGKIDCPNFATMHSCTPSKNCMAMIWFYILLIDYGRQVYCWKMIENILQCITFLKLIFLGRNSGQCEHTNNSGYEYVSSWSSLIKSWNWISPASCEGSTFSIDHHVWIFYSMSKPPPTLILFPFRNSYFIGYFNLSLTIRCVIRNGSVCRVLTLKVGDAEFDSRTVHFLNIFFFIG